MDSILIVGANALAIFLGGLWMKNYLPSYMSKKGVNLADKEDIEELTKKVEDVKASFSRNLESFRAKLDIHKSNHISYQKEERKVLITYHGLINKWILKIFSLDLYRIAKLSADEIMIVRKEMDLFPDLSIALSKVRLLIKDENLIQASRDLIQSVINYKSEVEKIVIDLQFKIQNKNHLHELWLKHTPKDLKSELHPEFIRLGNDIDQVMREINEHCDRYWQVDRIEYYRPVQQIDEDYVSKVKEYLTSKTVL